MWHHKIALIFKISLLSLVASYVAAGDYQETLFLELEKGKTYRLPGIVCNTKESIEFIQSNLRKSLPRGKMMFEIERGRAHAIFRKNTRDDVGLCEFDLALKLRPKRTLRVIESGYTIIPALVEDPDSNNYDSHVGFFSLSFSPIEGNAYVIVGTFFNANKRVELKW